MEVFLILAVLGVVSFVLAFLSMKDFKEEPQKKLDYQLFLIRNHKHLSKEGLDRLFEYLINKKTFVSLERLFKGHESVLVIFAPMDFTKDFPFFEPLLLEDYLALTREEEKQDKNKIGIDRSFVFEIRPPKDEIKVSEMFNNFHLEPNQQFFYQIVAGPVQRLKDSFQITIRAMVVDQTSQKRLDLAKKIKKSLQGNTNLNLETKRKPAKTLYNFFVKRYFVPEEVQKFVVKDEILLSLLGF